MFYREFAFAYPNHCFKTCGGAKDFTSSPIFKKCGGIASSGEQEQYILKTNLELPYQMQEQ